LARLKAVPYKHSEHAKPIGRAFYQKRQVNFA